jgi:hypothetical protein
MTVQEKLQISLLIIADVQKSLKILTKLKKNSFEYRLVEINKNSKGQKSLESKTNVNTF